MKSRKGLMNADVDMRYYCEGTTSTNKVYSLFRGSNYRITERIISEVPGKRCKTEALHTDFRTDYRTSFQHLPRHGAKFSRPLYSLICSRNSLCFMEQEGSVLIEGHWALS